MTETKLTKAELTQWMKAYDFVKYVKELDRKADDYKRSEKAKETLNGKNRVVPQAQNRL